MYNSTGMRTCIVLVIVLMFSGICMAADREYKKPEIAIDENQLHAIVQKLTGIIRRNYGILPP
jgi:hypothetical protein